MRAGLDGGIGAGLDVGMRAGMDGDMKAGLDSGRAMLDDMLKLNDDL